MSPKPPARPRVFISYSHADGRAAADRLFADVRAAGLDPWMDREDLPPGANWQREIEASLRDAAAVVVVCTAGAMASDEVMSEWSFARQRGLPVIPYRAAPCELNYRLTLLHACDTPDGLVDRLRELAGVGDPRLLAGPNPFVWRSGIKDATRFFDRDQTLAAVLGFMAHGQNCQLVGPRRIGRTSLLLQIERTVARLHPNAEVAYLDLEMPHFETQRGWLRRCGEAFGWRRPPADRVEFSESLEAGHRAGRRSVLLLDEFEQLTRRPHEFPYEFFTTLRSCSQSCGLSLVTTSRRRLGELVRGDNDVSRFFNIFPLRTVGPFDPADATDFLVANARFLDPGGRDRVGRFAGGHPLALQVACYWAFEAAKGGGTLDAALGAADEELRDALPSWRRGDAEAERP